MIFIRSLIIVSFCFQNYKFKFWTSRLFKTASADLYAYALLISLRKIIVIYFLTDGIRRKDSRPNWVAIFL